MRNIWTIFKTDIRTLSRCFFACVVVLAIALLPSLYAWLNIYSNWDPYGPASTSNIKVAVANEDDGAELLGMTLNIGEMVMERLKPLDEVAYIRFASIYHRFQDAGSFMREISKFLEEK